MMNCRNWLGAAALAACACAGCGKGDGAKDFEAGRAALARRDWSQAETSFARAAKACATNTAAWYSLALARIELNEIAAADAAIRTARELDGETPEIQVCEARIAYLLKDYERAETCWRTVAADQEVPAEVRSQAYSDLSALAVVLGDPDAARLHLYRGLRLNRKDPQIWYHLGKLYRNQFKFDYDALECYRFYVHLAKDNPADAEYVQRVSDRVIPELQAVVAGELAEIAGGASKRDQGKAAAAVAEGNRLAGQKKLALAAKKYEEALKADPLNAPAALALAQAAEKAATGAQGWQKALAAWKTASHLSPNSMSAHVGVARMALKVGHWSEAAGHLSRALAKDPADTQTLALLVEAYRKCGQGKVADAYQAYSREIASKKK